MPDSDEKPGALRSDIAAIHGNLAVRMSVRRGVYARVRAYYLARRKEEATQREIAAELGIPVGTLYRWIKASWKKPRPSRLDEIAAHGPVTSR